MPLTQNWRSQFKIKAVDVNCPQHIVQRYTSEEIDQMMTPLKERITELENELEDLDGIYWMSTILELRLTKNIIE